MFGIISVTGYALIVTYVLFSLIGLAVGSFLNVVIYRVPHGMSIATPPSHCVNCGYRLKWYDNIPILSYCILKGKCRSCKKHISFRYTIVEIANMLLWMLCVYRFNGNVVYASLSAISVSVCICVFFIDLEHMIIPDRFQIVFAFIGIAAIFFDTDVSWYDHFIGMAIGLFVLVTVAYFVEKACGKESLGGGDVKLTAVCGLFLGWQKLILMMLIASVAGSIGLVLLKRRKRNTDKIPFAPFLTAGFVFSMFFGSFIIEWYISLF